MRIKDHVKLKSRPKKQAYRVNCQLPPSLAATVLPVNFPLVPIIVVKISPPEA